MSEIRQRAASSEVLVEITIFAGEWPKTKPQLVALLKGIETEQLPLVVSEYSDTTDEEEQLSVAQAFVRLQAFRAIALEQDMLQQLKLGHISRREEYQPPNEDEA